MVDKLNRRDFISATAVAGTAMLMEACKSRSGEQPAGVKKSSLSTINVALIGYGEEGKVLLESLLNIEGIRLVAICDIWDYHRGEGQRYLQKLGNEIRSYENYEDLLAKEKDLQAVFIATPDFWHAPMTNTCLKAGLHVYCEKMMSNTIEGARSMVQTVRETGKLLQIGHQRRSNPLYLFTLNRLLHDAQFCGRLTAVQGQWNRAVKEDFGWPKKFEMPAPMLAKYGFKDMHQFRNWRWTCRPGWRRLSDLGAHQIDIFNWWLGTTPKSVVASGGLDYFKNHDWYDNAMVICEYQLTQRGVTSAFSTKCRPRPVPAAATSNRLWGMMAPSRCLKIPPSAPSIVRLALTRFHGTTLLRRATCVPFRLPQTPQESMCGKRHNFHTIRDSRILQ